MPLFLLYLKVNQQIHQRTTKLNERLVQLSVFWSNFHLYRPGSRWLVSKPVPTHKVGSLPQRLCSVNKCQNGKPYLGREIYMNKVWLLACFFRMGTSTPLAVIYGGISVPFVLEGSVFIRNDRNKWKREMKFEGLSPEGPSKVSVAFWNMNLNSWFHLIPCRLKSCNSFL